MTGGTRVAFFLAAALSTACAPASRPVAPPPNVLLLTADSLRADAVDWRPGGATPALASLAARGVRFENAYTVAPWTAPSLVSVFTGLYPPTHGVVHRDDTTPATLPTLPRLLSERGFSLANFGFFTTVSYYRNLGLPPQAVKDAEIVGARALAGWLGSAPEPFFAWLHLVDPHLPYGATGYEAAEARVKGSSGLERAQVSATVPLGAGLAFEEGDRERVRALYEEDVARMDEAVGEVLAALSARGVSSRTVVLFTADHGEELLDHGWVGHASTSGEAALTEEVLRVPLVVAGPGVPAGRVAPGLAQVVDVAPTLLDLCGLPPPAGTQGISLAPAFAGKAPRRRVYFDTTPGGHLTPEGRRAERLQGAGDGRRLHVERLGAEARAGDASFADLAKDLARFRKEQARARLRLLSGHGLATRPDPVEVARWPETLPVLEPPDGAALGFAAAGGEIRIRWEGEAPAGSPFWVEYDVGSGLLSTRGAFPVEEPRVSFGPFPVAFWNDLAGYSPFRFRVLDPAARTRSPWRTFRLEKGEGARR